VTSWGPVKNVNEDGIPPGRTAHVFTSHESVFNWAEGLPDDFAAQTANGMMPSGNFLIPKDEDFWKYTGPENPKFTIPSDTTSEYPSDERLILVSTPPFAPPVSQNRKRTVNQYKGSYSSSEGEGGDSDNDGDNMDLDDS
jgi:hypothetical protein